MRFVRTSRFFRIVNFLKTMSLFMRLMKLNRSTVIKMCKFRASNASNFFLYVRIIFLKSFFIINKSRHSSSIKFFDDVISFLMLENVSRIDLTDSENSSLIRFMYAYASEWVESKPTQMGRFHVSVWNRPESKVKNPNHSISVRVDFNPLRTQ
jgi:hypothetical protein